MSKALKIAAIVVGVAAVILSAGTALGLIAPIYLGAIGLASTTLVTALTLGATVLGVAASLLAKRPKLASAFSSGSQLDWVADPASGEPYVMGDAMVGMDIVHQATWGDKNRYLGMVGIMSCAGPIMAYDGLYADGNLIAFSSGNAVGYYNNFMYQHTQLGAVPESANLDMSLGGGMPDWGSAYKLSGLAAAGVILVADVDNGKIYAGGVPKMTHRIRGVKAYDPRLDTTNGGSGAQRTLTESTYAYSANPWVHHGTFALGRYENGYRVIGPGVPANKIDWASHIAAANIADANGWKISGRIMSTDNKWEVLKAIAQAGGGDPIPTGATLAALVNTPRVSLETINAEDVRGAVSVPQMAMRRNRINGAIPRYRDAGHGWEITPGNTVRNATYLSADGGNEHTREVDFALVADNGDGLGKTQAAQLAAYEVANSREKVGISVDLGLEWGQYKVGDCLTLNLPDANLINQKAVVIGRTFNADRNNVTFEFRTETDAKHTWALGLAGSTQAPPTIVTPPGTGDVPTPLSLADIQTALRNTYTNDLVVDAIDATGSATVRLHGASVGSNFTIQYPGKAAVVHAAVSFTGKAYTTTYYAYFDIDPAVGPGDPTPTFGLATTYANAINSATNPYRVFLARQVTTPASGGTTTTGGGTGGGYTGGGFSDGTGGGGTSYP